MTRRLRQLIPCVLLLFLVACGAREDEFLRESVLVDTPSVASGDSSPSRGSSEDEGTAPEQNHYANLSVPTCVTKVGDLYFIVDCYHDQVIYNDNLEDPVAEWSVMPTGTSLRQPHTIASDGVVYLVDDTENNRVVIYEQMHADGTDMTEGTVPQSPESGDRGDSPAVTSVPAVNFTLTQYFDDIGVRPHFTVYDEPTKTFYVWSSFSGEMYLFRRRESDNRVLLTDVKKVPELAGVYVRSFTIDGDEILFVSGLAVADEVYGDAADLPPLQERATGVILACDKKTFEVEARYPVPDEIAGMVQVANTSSTASVPPSPQGEGQGWFITVSTDRGGNAEAATILFCERLEDLASGDYVEVYDEHFIGGGTPYYMGVIDGAYYLTEHRVPGVSIWRFLYDNGISNATQIY